ncbi:MAG TPA: 30S ribosomal protein S9 [Nanoarchaeota archaeon]|nr:30S ribosomal protein S9 [Candidatus Woesearchaeota archaeon]HIH15453.1 30S ribosomal protein S9 [Nanoarchaeota archaeon]HIH59256.1 30S ribosomal protein S9 [Nanoarchaeota archaeon]HII13949.1 30S ribosomal protein S9 [Nanoarchaeota archaeon]HIJ04707.1 30S ribosomal protein S9 [Nanoarchaeota archaeon]
MKVVQVSGKRKRAVARARLKEGKGIIRFNALQLDGVSPELARLMIMEPLILAGDLAKSVDIDVRVQGGGWHSQAEAARLVIARGLVQFSGSKALKQKFIEYDRHLLVADTRRAEHSKPNDSKPRAKRQKSYR